MSLTSLPPHARYTLAGMGGGFTKEGVTPDYLPEVPAGSYQLTLNQAGLPPYSEMVQVPAHAVQAEKADLVLLSPQRRSRGPIR